MTEVSSMSFAAVYEARKLRPELNRFSSFTCSE